MFAISRRKFSLRWFSGPYDSPIWMSAIVFLTLSALSMECALSIAAEEEVIPSVAGEAVSSDVMADDPWQNSGHPLNVPASQPTWGIKVDYLARSLTCSQMSYEIGTVDPPPNGYAPLSKLQFPLDSVWHGLHVALERPEWEVHFEWATPMTREIHGSLSDYDWDPPNKDGSFTDLGQCDQRWTDGQMLNLTLEHKFTDSFFGLPMEIWPEIGFRWQRFDVMTYNLVQVKEGNVWPPNPYTFAGDVISYNEQYYTCFVGGQLRKTLQAGNFKPIKLKFQGDWGFVSEYGIDHHLLRTGDMYGLQSTYGDSWHISLNAEIPLTKRLRFGFQADYLQILTTGSTREWNAPEATNVTWTNGVRTYSNQTWLTAYLGMEF